MLTGQLAIPLRITEVIYADPDTPVAEGMALARYSAKAEVAPIIGIPVPGSQVPNCLGQRECHCGPFYERPELILGRSTGQARRARTSASSGVSGADPNFLICREERVIRSRSPQSVQWRTGPSWDGQVPLVHGWRSSRRGR
jgi:hypothetical protein